MAGEAHVLQMPSTAAELPPDWSWKRLDAVCEGVFDCPHSTPVLTEDGPYLARSQDMRSGVFRTEEAAHVSEATYNERIARAEPRHGDLLYSREGTYFGIAAEMPAAVRACLGQRMVLIRPSPSAVSFRFLRYWLNSPVMALHTGGYRDGSVAERLNLPTIRALPIAVPPLPEQRAIAHILGALDDKIELKRRMNETLEAMARAMFTSWFVDFDPVRAKAEGRDPGLPKPFADLFPPRLVDSELGYVPEGWEVGPILNHARLMSGGTPKTDRPEYWGGSIYWASAADVSQSSGSFLVETERSITEQGLDESATQMVPALCSVVVARGATTGRMVMLGRDMAMNQTCYALVTSTGTPFALYCRLREEIDALVHAAHGSVFDTITTTTFASSRFVLPPKRVLTAFEDHAAPLFHRALRSAHESRTLAALGDTLLPKLISGELRVKDAERFVRAAM
jgi:type I restriction enzyme S subunit